MRRVPPNFLVGQGAIQFARDSHIPVLLDEFLISPSSRARWNKWRQDLQLAREKEIEKLQNPSSDEEDEDPISNDEDAQLAENSPGKYLYLASNHSTAYCPLAYFSF